MEDIGGIRPYLLSHGDSFVVEALGKNLDQALVKEALKETGPTFRTSRSRFPCIATGDSVIT